MKLYYTKLDGSTMVEETYDPIALARYLHIMFKTHKDSQSDQPSFVITTMHDPSNQAEIIEEFRSLCLHRHRGKYHAIMREAILTVALPETLASIKLLGLLDTEVLEMPF